jgi:hypothetical protein
VRMDPPEHTAYRALTAGWFHPRTHRALEDDVRALARAAVDAMAERGDTPTTSSPRCRCSCRSR